MSAQSSSAVSEHLGERVRHGPYRAHPAPALVQQQMHVLDQLGRRFEQAHQLWVAVAQEAGQQRHPGPFPHGPVSECHLAEAQSDSGPVPLG